jgi:hypothetical protein
MMRGDGTQRISEVRTAPAALLTQPNGVGMPAFYKIDKQRRLVLSTGSGVITRQDVLGHQEKLAKDPDFEPSFSQLADFTHITKLEINEQDVRLFAQRSLCSPNSRRAFIAGDEPQFKFTKLFEALREEAGERGIRVFRTLDDGLDWIFSVAQPPRV